MENSKRLIKFRAWDRERKEWQYFTLHQLSMGQTGLFWSALEKWCESTGLLDKNGKEIYEGDIVRHFISNIDTGEGEFEVREKVVFDLNHCGFVLKGASTGSGSHIFSVFSKLYFEVIGNIYENPELLK